MLPLLLSWCCGLIELPASITQVVLNIGSNLQLTRPPSDSTVAVVAFEPIVHCKIEATERLYVVPAAVSAADSVSTMRVLGQSGVSSSLAKPSKLAQTIMMETKDKEEIRLVPVLAMKSVLDSLPQQIVFLKTDMQGHDFQTLQSAGRQLAERVHYIHSEVFYAGA
eukprot:503549-Prymnesium_polylepis.1